MYTLWRILARGFTRGTLKFLIVYATVCATLDLIGVLRFHDFMDVWSFVFGGAVGAFIIALFNLAMTTRGER